jgi:hypothetical protein
MTALIVEPWHHSGRKEVEPRPRLESASGVPGQLCSCPLLGGGRLEAARAERGLDGCSGMPATIPELLVLLRWLPPCRTSRPPQSTIGTWRDIGRSRVGRRAIDCGWRQQGNRSSPAVALYLAGGTGVAGVCFRGRQPPPRLLPRLLGSGRRRVLSPTRLPRTLRE